MRMNFTRMARACRLALLCAGLGAGGAGDIKPGEGLTNPVNLMAYSWAQGYLSAANIALVEADAKHVDMGQLDENRVLNLLLNFCKANPDKQPLGALNDYLRKTAKVHIKWEKGTIDWNQ